MIRNERVTAQIEGEFVVFLIGMRLNKLTHVLKWMPVLTAMPRMLKELYARPELGLMAHEMWFARTSLLVQYWRSVDHLMAYSKASDSSHLPAWQNFNKRISTDGSVGIWHETYIIRPGSYENIFVNMPAFGIGKAGELRAATGELRSAKARLTI